MPPQRRIVGAWAKAQPDQRRQEDEHRRESPAKDLPYRASIQIRSGFDNLVEPLEKAALRAFPVMSQKDSR